jgi:hypothetical protein
MMTQQQMQQKQGRHCWWKKTNPSCRKKQASESLTCHALGVTIPPQTCAQHTTVSANQQQEE